MAADFTLPTVSGQYTDIPGQIRDNVNAAITAHESDASTNKPTGTKQITSTGVVKRWNGSSWVTLHDAATHIADTSNPHSVTKTQVGLSNVPNSVPLLPANNLSDLTNAATARSNLGIIESVAGGYLGSEILGSNILGG
jgi:hypothetical protein